MIADGFIVFIRAYRRAALHLDVARERQNDWTALMGARERSRLSAGRRREWLSIKLRRKSARLGARLQRLARRVALSTIGSIVNGGCACSERRLLLATGPIGSAP